MVQQPGISVIIPVRNESVEVLSSLHQFAELESIDEIIVSDSSDLQTTVDELNAIESRYANYHLVHCDIPGRAAQMNCGAKHAKFQILWFVHADTKVPKRAGETIQRCVASGYHWGRFDVDFDCDALWMKMIAWAMNIRSSFSKICTGDQAIYVTHDLFSLIKGYPDVAIMEDIALSKLLKAQASMFRVRHKVITSARRWENHGYMRTVLLMWAMRFLYWAGMSTGNLAKFYHHAHRCNTRH